MTDRLKPVDDLKSTTVPLVNDPFTLCFSASHQKERFKTQGGKMNNDPSLKGGACACAWHQ